MRAMVVHGGAGEWAEAKLGAARDGVARAAQVGRSVLSRGGTALDAVTEAVVVLEDDPLFNAGTGAALSIDGRIELDACVMVSEGLRAGAIAGVERVQNPVRLARAVMEHTDHVLLAGVGAERFARALGIPAYDAETPDRRAAWERARARLDLEGDGWLPRLHALLQRYPSLAHGTVGAVALDEAGTLAAATSTGGVVLKLVGRIGDAPIPGAGTYACPAGAAGATGRGEIAMRLLATRRVCALIEAGLDAHAAAERTLIEARPLGSELALIAVDAAGTLGVAHATPHLPHATWQEGRAVDARVSAR